MVPLGTRDALSWPRLQRKNSGILTLFILVLVQVAFGQSPEGEREGFFGPPKQGPSPVPPDAQKLEIIDGAKNPELIPEIYRWGQFRRMVLEVHRSLASINSRSRPLERAYHSQILSLLGDKFDLVADLANRCDASMRKLSSAQTSLAGQSLPTAEFIAKTNGSVEQFKAQVLELLDNEQATQVKDYVSREAVKRIQWAKLPGR